SLARDGRFRCVTVSEFLQQYPLGHAESLPELSSGSWIDGNFATWIGHPEKNAAWERLAHARESLSSVGEGDPSLRKAWRCLRIAEGSDWMWWFGDTHFSAQAEEFDRLFRTHLSHGYELAGLPVPEALKTPIKRLPIQISYDPTGLIHPTIDGYETSYYEWLYAGRLDLRQQYSAIHRSAQCLRSIYHGFDRTHHYFRIDLDLSQLARLSSWVMDLSLSHDLHVQITQEASGVRAHVLPHRAAAVSCVLGRILEVSIPRELLGLEQGERLRLALALMEGREVRERYPSQGSFELMASTVDVEAQSWLVF
ncbi:MAG: hypothetical protein HYY90_01600, partial [Candidatus Omnitrophica bacterium]|nr:hypothetical protein [Candidatus Omnitrophota bacterium]